MHQSKPPLPVSATPTRGRLRKDPSETIGDDSFFEGQANQGRNSSSPRAAHRLGGGNRGQAITPRSAPSIDPSKLFSVDSEINHDILVLIRGYLRRCGLYATATTLQNESHLHTKQTKTAQRQVREAVLEGDWEALRELGKTAPAPKLRRAFTYLVNRQEFLELVNKQESQQAFAHLIRRLKPLEAQAKITGDDFRDLAYLATCRSVTDCPAFRNWEGVSTARRRLAKELCGMVKRSDLFVNRDEFGAEDEEDTMQNDERRDGDDPEGASRGRLDNSDSDNELDSLGGDDTLQSFTSGSNKPVRLVTLLQQAYAYQVEKKTPVEDLLPDAVPRVSSLLMDFSPPLLPDPKRSLILSGHEQSVKCLTFVGQRRLLASGSSDCDISLWDWGYDFSLNNNSNTNGNARTVTNRSVLRGHTGRVWDCSANVDGSLLASVSADSTLRIWNLNQALDDDISNSPPITSTIIDAKHTGDIYSVSFHPESTSHVVTAGHDQTVNLIDLEREVVVKTFKGHQGSVVDAIFNPVGNLIVTGSKDATVKFFDLVSGVCVRTIPQLLGAVTSVELNKTGEKLLTGTKDSSNRLWDIRTGNCLSRFKGHVNTSKNFIRAHFGSSDQIVIGGSEDGAVYVWDAESGRVMERLTGHAGSVFRASWCSRWNVLGSCSEDGTVRIWDAKKS